MRGLLLKAFAVAAACMMLGMPTSYAATVANIFAPGFSTPLYSTTVKELVSLQFRAESKGFSNWDIVLTVGNKEPGKTLASVYVYKCKALTPSQCASPGAYVQHAPGEIRLDWSEVASGQTTPQTGSILLVAKVNTPSGITWESEWLELRRESGQVPQWMNPNNDIASASVNAKGFSEAAAVKSFIETNNVLPFRGDWVSSVKFPSASGYHDLSGSPPPATGQLVSGDAMLSPPAEFSLAFPNTGSVRNGLTIYNSPSTSICGDNVCDAGENCCYDCGCSSNLYCDTANICSLPPSLQVASPTNTNVANCNQQNTVLVTVKMNNAPTDVQVTGQTYILGGTGQYTATCPETYEDTYTCNLAVPPPSQCNAGSYQVKDNSITFGIRYSNGPDTVQDSLTVPFPDITIGSWECGNGIAETSLGESYSNCCYDVACPSGKYCDYVPGSPPESGACQSMPAGLTIQNFTAPPSHGPTGASAFFGVKISNTPSTLAVGQESCSISCVSGYANCTSTCDLSCIEQPWTTEYATSCTMTLLIIDYNKTQSYSLLPGITFPATYQNGSSLKSTDLTGQAPAINFGPSFCGNSVCDIGESSANCCIDCGCDSGQYCNTYSPPNPSGADVCSLSDIQLVLDDVSGRDFVDQNMQHAVNVTARITNPPPNGMINAKYFCSLWGGAVPGCIMTCDQGQPSTGSIPLECSVLIPAYYVPDTVEYVMENNLAQVSFEYNNKTGREFRVLEADIGDIKVTQVAHCGLDSCESFLGENAANCCIDCPCSLDGQFGSGFVCVPGGAVAASACVSNSTLTASVTEITPNPIECDILPQQGFGDCRFPEPTETFTIQVNNAPSSLRLLRAEQELNGGEREWADCKMDEENLGKFTCDVYIQSIEDPGGCGSPFSCLSGGVDKQNVTFFLSTEYREGGFPITTTFQAYTEFSVKKDDKNLLSCERQRARHESDIKTYEKNKNLLEGIIYTVWGIVAIDYLKCSACNTPGGQAGCVPIFGGALGLYSCTEIGGVATVAACLTSVLLLFSPNYKEAIDKTEAKLQAVCESPNTEGMIAPMQGSPFDIYGVLEVGSTLVCIFGAFGGGPAGGGGTPPTTSSPPGFGGLPGSQTVNPPGFGGPPGAS